MSMAQIVSLADLMALRILFSNLGYARGINGQLTSHARHVYRHVFNSASHQTTILNKLKTLITETDPDLCCFVEIDQGSFASSRHNQIIDLLDEPYVHFDISCKYGLRSLLRSFVFTQGKSNAFIAKRSFTHQRIYLNNGLKRLVYKVQIEKNLVLFFAHFSLRHFTRRKQFTEMVQLMRQEIGDVILLGDFNIMKGLQELGPFLDDPRFIMVNNASLPTFTLHKKRILLDLCIASRSLLPRLSLDILPQYFSDHDALLLHIS